MGICRRTAGWGGFSSTNTSSAQIAWGACTTKYIWAPDNVAPWGISVAANTPLLTMGAPKAACISVVRLGRGSAKGVFARVVKPYTPSVVQTVTAAAGGVQSRLVSIQSYGLGSVPTAGSGLILVVVFCATVRVAVHEPSIALRAVVV